MANSISVTDDLYTRLNKRRMEKAGAEGRRVTWAEFLEELLR